MRKIFNSKSPPKVRACADSRHDFSLKSPVHSISGASYKTRNETKWNETKRNEMEKIVKSVDSIGVVSEMRLQLSLRLGGLTAGRQVTLARHRVWTQSNVEGVWTPSRGL